MKKTIKIILIIMAAVLLFVVAVKLIYIGDGKIAQGIYKIKEFERYPDAYIEVNEDSIQFFNIDLNEIYQEGQLKQYNKMIGKNPDIAISEEEVQKYSDLNSLMVQSAYPVDFEQGDDIKSGTFTYDYSLYTKAGFGLGIQYNSLRKTIYIGHFLQELTFEK